MTPDERDELLAKLTPKQRAFVEAYVSGKSASDAARAAGYVAKYAGFNADKVLKSAKVASAIKALTQPEREARRKRILSMAEIQAWWSGIVEGTEQPREGENLDRLSASRELARSLGGYLDRNENTNKTEVVIRLGIGNGNDPD